MALPSAALLCQAYCRRQTHLLLAALKAGGEEHHVDKAGMVAQGNQQKLSRSTVLPRVCADPINHPKCVQQGTSHALHPFTPCTDMPSPRIRKLGQARSAESGTAANGLKSVIFGVLCHHGGQGRLCLA